jgi:hypothetical protein
MIPYSEEGGLRGEKEKALEVVQSFFWIIQRKK